MIEQIIKNIPIHIDNIDNQVRDKKFPDRVEYLKKIKKLSYTNISKIQTSFFQGIRLTYRAKTFQTTNNTFLIISIVLFCAYFVLNTFDEKNNIEILTMYLKTIILVLATLSFLICVLISFGFSAIRNTIYRLFNEIDSYDPSHKTTKSTSSKPNGK